MKVIILIIVMKSFFFFLNVGHVDITNV